MKTIAIIFMLCASLILGITPAQARRGNPVFHNAPKLQFYLVDSDDDHPLTPTYKFVDTLYDAAHWHRVTGFTNGGNPNNDDGCSDLTASDSILYVHAERIMRLPPRYISTNGAMKLTFDTFYTQPFFSPNNGPMPTGGATGFEAIVCPLWGDMELRTTGDSSKIFYRMTTDSCYVTYYNLFLKGSNGNVRATFQIAFAKADSSIQFNYKSFDGSFNGTSAALVFQNEATIGVQNAQAVYGTMYLDRGTYYAKTYSSQLYAQPLHNLLAVKFYRIIPNFIRTRSIDFPPTDRYEMLNNSFKPQATVENWMDQDRIIEINYKVTNLVTGTTLYNRTDSFDVGNSSTRADTASLYQGFPCGSYRLTVTSSIPSLGGDGWVPDNIMTRDFVYMKPDTGAMYDNFITLDPCQWHVDGATWVDAASVMFDPPSPRSTGALLLNRLDILGDPYLTTTGSDTATTTPINLAGKSNVWLSFSYQRGLSTDNQEAGTKASVLVGPEPLDMDSLNQGVYQGDSLVVEALPDTATRYNPSPATWAKIATLYGTLDFQTKKFRMQLGSKYVHDHTRIRIRLMAKDDHIKYGVPTDDNDSWVIDNVQISAPTGGQTDLEPTNIDLGAGNFTHIPRNVKLMNPKVTIGSNGLQSNGAVYVVHLVIQDNLNRFVYDKTQSLISPGPHTDVVVTMPIWDIQGSQGGKFTAKVTLAQNFNEYYRKNDTNTFIRSLFIDDVYALDDGVPDTVGTMTTAENNWFYYDFIPMSNDSLRGIDAYHLSESGNTNWTINIMDTANHVLGTRACSYNAVTPKAPGYVRGTFAPFGLTGGVKYRLQCIMTQGFNLGGDASKSLMWESTHSFNSPAYTALHPDILSSYRNSANTDYLTAKKNASAGGPILPMVRFVFQGSATYLPVEVASFSGKRTDLGFVSLGFRTAKEEGVDHFDIDRESVSGWVNAGSIIAKNSRLGADYALLDNQAPATSLTYRLVEVDLDGSRRIAGTTTVGPFGSSEEFSAKVFPNPTTQNIHVMLSGVSEESSLVLFDALGKVVASKEHVKATTADLDASTLGAGFYWLEAHSGDHTARIKVVVSH